MIEDAINENGSPQVDSASENSNDKSWQTVGHPSTETTAKDTPIHSTDAPMSASGRPAASSSNAPKATTSDSPDSTKVEDEPRPSTTPSPPSPKGTEKILNDLDDLTEKATNRATFFDFDSVLKDIAKGASSADIFPPLRAFLGSLEALTAVHPFIGIAVLPFKAIVKLELNRRQNDRRILTLIGQMADMMQHLGELPREQINEVQTMQFDSILAGMKQGISDCGNAIDLYYKSRLIVRVMKSLRWQEKFEEFAESFTKLKEDLRTRILVVIHLTSLETHRVTTSTQAKVDQVDVKLDDIKNLLRGRTALEKDISRFIERYGPMENFTRDDASLARLVKKVEGLGDERQVHFDPEHRQPRRRNSGNVYDGGGAHGYSGYGGYVGSAGPYGAPPAATPSLIKPSPLPQSPYAPYTPRAAVSSMAENNAYGYGSGYVPSPQRPQSMLPPQPHQPKPSSPYTLPASLPGSGYPGSGYPMSSYGVSPYGTMVPQQPGMTPSYLSPYPMTPGSMPPGAPVIPGYQPMTPGQPVQSMGYASIPPVIPSYVPSGGSFGTRNTERASARRDSSSSRAPNKDVVEYDGSVKATLLEEYRFVIRGAIETDLSVMIQRNQQVWEVTLRHFEMEIKAHIDQGTMRVLQKLSEGPYTRVTDPILRKIWEAEKWPISVEGPKFIQCLQDHLEQDVSESDAWAIKFLNVSHRVPLLHTVDPDYSGFVSVNEANNFTRAKPEGQSLLVWLAYSAVAWSYEANECHRQILEAREKITNSIDPFQPGGGRRRAEDVTLALRDIESKISGELEGVLLASLRVSQQRIAQMTETEPLRLLLEQGLATRKNRLTEKLESIRWDVSSPSTLRAVAGDGPIENYVLLLSCLVITRLVNYLVDTDFGVKTGRHDRTIYQRIFGTSEALLQIFSSVDERVFYLRDSFPDASISQFAFGLFSNWVPKDISVGSSMPDLSISPKPAAREPRPEGGDSRASSPRPQEDDANPYQSPSPTPEPTSADDPDTPFIPDTPRREDSWESRGSPRSRSPPGWGPTRGEEWGGATPGPRHKSSTRERTRSSSYAPGPYGSYPAGESFNPTAVWPPTPGFNGMRDAFLRPPGPRLHNQSAFEEFNIAEDLGDLLRALPPLPNDLYGYDTQHSEWTAFVSAMRAAFQPDPIVRLTLRQQARAVRAVVDAWNHHFFLRRHIYIRLSKVHRRPRRRSFSDDEHSDSSISSYDEGPEDAEGNTTYRRRSSRSHTSRSRQNKPKPAFSYRISAAAIPDDDTAQYEPKGYQDPSPYAYPGYAGPPGMGMPPSIPPPGWGMPPAPVYGGWGTYGGVPPTPRGQPPRASSPTSGGGPYGTPYGNPYGTPYGDFVPVLPSSPRLRAAEIPFGY